MILTGQPLEDQLTSLNLSNELDQLQSRGELNELYQLYMKKAEVEALKDFTELLWEHPELFIARTEERQKELLATCHTCRLCLCCILKAIGS